MKKLFFSDFDGTLTLSGQLLPNFFTILEEVKRLNSALVVVSGRSNTWGHFLISHFKEMQFSIMEGGGVILRREKSGFHREVLVDESETTKLQNFTKSLLEKFSNLSLSVDSASRITDRAVELSDLEADPELMKDVKSFMDEEGIIYSTSNVHLNFWCGEISKYKAVNYFLETYFPEILEDSCYFFGDSLNDESMFESFRNTVGVSDISECIDRLKYKPTVILEGEINKGPYGVLNYLREFKE
jgi:HAD superfamily hydrolase (TIGR01484 family)